MGRRMIPAVATVLCSIALSGEHTGVDLRHYAGADGRSIRRAIDFLLPYAPEEKPGPVSKSYRWTASEWHRYLEWLR